MKSYYWCSDTIEEVTKEEANALEKQGEFVTTSYASAIFYLCK